MQVVSIKFKGRGKTYYFDPNGLEVAEGDQVVVETSKGLELAVCVQGNHEVTDERIVPPLRPVARIATADDLRIAELCKKREQEAFAIAEQKIAEHGLDMKLVDVECNFEGSKILFFFTSDGRVDFRELVKDLAGVFRTRIELRQIGVRDEAKMLGGIGICGLPFCCHQFMDDFQPVSTKMAKTQSLSLNPTKISGSCGRLMCCLRYEQEAYEELVKGVPKNGAFVETPVGYGNVAQVNLLRQTVKVKLDDDDSLRSFDADEVATVPGGRPKPGETPPHVLKVVPKKKIEAEETKDDGWSLPPIFADDTASEAVDKPEGEGVKRSSRRRRSRSGKGGEKSGGERTGGEKSPEKQENKPEKAEKFGKRFEKAGGPEKAEKAGDGEKTGGSHRRHRKPGGEQGREFNREQGQKKPAKPAPERAEKAPNPPKNAEGGSEKKSSSSRRRYRKPRPKTPGEGGGKAE